MPDKNPGRNRLFENTEKVTLRSLDTEKVCSPCLPGKKENLATAQKLADANGGFNSRDAPHRNVCEQHIRPQFLCYLDCFLAAVPGFCLEPAKVQDCGQCICDNCLVIRNKDQRPGSKCRHLNSLPCSRSVRPREFGDDRSVLLALPRRENKDRLPCKVQPRNVLSLTWFHRALPYSVIRITSAVTIYR